MTARTTSLNALARTDFQRPLKLAMTITDDTVSTLAQLSVCRGVLKSSEDRGEENLEGGKGRAKY
jgi:hypothetical protein